MRNNEVTRSELQQTTKVVQDFLLDKINKQQTLINDITEINKRQMNIINKLIEKVKQLEEEIEFLKDNNK